MKFDVTYINEFDERESKIEAGISEDDIIIKYKSLDYKIIKIDKVRELSINDLIDKKIPNIELIEFLTQLSILISAGYSIKDSIFILKEQKLSSNLKNTLSQVDQMINNGYSLSQAMYNTNKFPTLVTNVIKAAEESASLEKSLKLLSTHYNEENKIKTTIRNSLYYPTILLIVTFVVIILIMSFVLPKYVDLYQSFGAENLPLITLILINISKIITNNFFIITLFFLSLIFILYKYFSLENNKIKLHKFLLYIPLFGEYLMYIDLQRYSGVFSLMISSGLDLLEVLDISSKTIENKYLSTEFNNIRDKVNNGNSLYDSFMEITLLPSIFTNLINIGEQSSSLDNTLLISYNYFTDLLNNKSKKIISLLEPTITIFLGLIIGLIVLAIVMPSLNIINII